MSSDSRRKIVIFRGNFNPPHLGHVEAVKTVAEQLNPDKVIVIPGNTDLADEEDWPSPAERFELCKLAFEPIRHCSVNDMEIHSSGRCYAADTVRRLREAYPDDVLYLIIGSDDFLNFEDEYCCSDILSACRLAVLARTEDDYSLLIETADRLTEKFGGEIEIFRHDPLRIRSDMVRERLRIRLGEDQLTPDVYAAIIRNRWYSAEPELAWLREQVIPHLKPKRMAHVAGCESEAVQLAVEYGENPEKAAEAAILHDITKALSLDEQLQLARKYGIILDDAEKENGAILHARTGAALAKDLFGVPDDVMSAIRWHTTGKPDMTLLEKIIYMADYIEPTRDFPGVDKLREEVYRDLDAAMALGLKMSLEDIRSRGNEPYKDTVLAEAWYRKYGGE